MLSNKTFLFSLLTLRDETHSRPGAQGRAVVVGATGGGSGCASGGGLLSPQNPCVMQCCVGANALLNALYAVCPASVTARLSPNPWGAM